VAAEGAVGDADSQRRAVVRHQDVKKARPLDPDFERLLTPREVAAQTGLS
jgi:hypothetical protein